MIYTWRRFAVYVLIRVAEMSLLQGCKMFYYIYFLVTWNLNPFFSVVSVRTARFNTMSYIFTSHTPFMCAAQLLQSTAIISRY